MCDKLNVCPNLFQIICFETTDLTVDEIKRKHHTNNVVALEDG